MKLQKYMIKNLYDNNGVLPYPGPGVADGLAFSSGNGSLPYSLEIIYEKLKQLYGVTRVQTDLDDWAEQGVLLLNPVLTTRSYEAHVHEHIGWQMFTQTALNNIPQPVVYMAWGNPAKAFVESLSVFPYAVITGKHPSSVCRGYKFHGGFKECNEFLKELNHEPIKWV